MTIDKNDKLKYEFLSSVLDQLQTNFYITDCENDQIVYMNRIAKNTFGVEHPEGCVCWKIIQKGMKKRCSFCRTKELLKEDGEKVCVWNEVNTVTGRHYKNYDFLMEWNGKLYHAQQSIDVTEYEEMSMTASIDELTGMLNRRAGKERMDELMQEAKAEGEVLAVILYDINGLKVVNDLYGHSEGDKLIQYISAITKKCLNPKDEFFRLSGDEFILILYGESLEKADVRMQQVLKCLKEERAAFDIFYEASFSYGMLQVYPAEQYSVMDIISRADEQMYIQKRNYHIQCAKEKLLKTAIPKEKSSNFLYDIKHLYEALASSTNDYLFVGNLKTGVFQYPKEMVEEFGLPSTIVENAAAFWGKLIHSEDEKMFLESNQEIADGRIEQHSIEYRARNVQNEWIQLCCRGTMIRNDQGEPELFAGFISNLDKQKQIDPLTGLYNRFEFEKNVRKYIEEKRETDQEEIGIGIMILNVDALKNINDLYNRSFGDEVLRLLSYKITRLLPENAKLFRLDGDEFGILIQSGSEEEGIDIYSRIHHHFKRQQEHEGKKYYCTLSAGYVSWPKDAVTYQELLKYANYSLEHSKNMGKNRMTIFSDEIIEKKGRRLEIMEMLRASIEKGFEGFTLYYQPQMDAMTKELYGAEALVRWHCEKYGNVMPGEFISILEQNGLIVQLGYWIFQTAAEKCKEWSKKKSDFRMSINVSYRQLLEGDMLYFIQKTLNELELIPSSITVELTETYFTDKNESIFEIIEEMRKLGIQIAMDDFGTGYSSLASLKNLPADIVKIDRGFVKSITTDLFNASFIRAISELCHDMGKEVCVEGVEGEEEYAIVKAIGPERIQGFYFGRPVTEEQFETLFLNPANEKKRK